MALPLIFIATALGLVCAIMLRQMLVACVLLLVLQRCRGLLQACACHVLFDPGSLRKGCDGCYAQRWRGMGCGLGAPAHFSAAGQGSFVLPFLSLSIYSCTFCIWR